MNYVASPAHLRAYVYAVIILLAVNVREWVHASDLPGTDIMVRVERALVNAGYERASGYSRLPAPPVEYVDEIAGGHWGAYSRGRIEISRRQPRGCIPTTLAHEVSHDAAIRMGFLIGVPNENVKAVLETVARVAESAIGAEDFAPNCLMRRAAL
jgi:hypothetical protein